MSAEERFWLSILRMPGQAKAAVCQAGIEGEGVLPPGLGQGDLGQAWLLRSSSLPGTTVSLDTFFLK